MCFIRELKFLQRYDPYIIRQGLLISNIFSLLKAMFFICFSTVFQLFRNAFKTLKAKLRKYSEKDFKIIININLIFFLI